MSTQKSGIINSDQTWSGDILVTGSVKVTNGATLTISAGTQITVQSGGNYKIWIDSTGFLVANTNNDDISISSDGSGTDDWKGIEFTDNTSSNSSSGSSLKGVTISNATYGVNVKGQGILIDDCVFENNGKSIYLTNTDSVKITNSTFKDTNGCIDTPYEVSGYGPHNNTEISNNNFLGGGTAVAIWPNQRNVDDLTITNNLVADSHSLGFQVGGGGYGSHIGDVEISNNEIKSTSGISIDAYSWVNDDTPGLKINKNYISGTGTGIAFGHADSFSTNNIQINENHFKNNGTSLSYGNDQNFGTGPHFSLTGNVFDSVGVGTDLKGLAVTASSNSFANTSNYVIKNANANTSFSGNNITSFSGTSVFHTRDTSNLGTAISLGTNYFDSTSKSADLADDGAENFEYKTIEVSGYAGSAYSVSLPADVPTNASPTLSSSKKSFSDGTEDTNYLITKTDLLTGYSDAEFDTLSISGLAFSSGSSSQSGDNYTYTPASGTTGSITISYSITDGDGGTLSASNTLNIQASDDGDASFAISGTTQVGQALSITESTADPDGTGTLSYVWQSSSDETTWTQIGTDSTYTLTSSEEGKKIRAIISYTDGQGFSESVTTSAVDFSFVDDGDAVFAISGTTQVGQALSITESSEDPDGTGFKDYNYSWQSSSDGTTWSQIGQAFASGYEPYTTKSSTTAGETLTTEVGSSITLNANGTISISGSYTSNLNADQNTALAGNNFTKIYAGGYGHLAGQRSDGSLLVLGYSIDNESNIYNLLNNSFTDIKFNYAAGGAKNSSNKIITWGHSSYYDSLEQQYTDNFSTYTLTSSEEGKKVRAVITYSDGSDFSESVTAAGVDIKTDDGDAVFAISGTTQVGQALSITESTADPDGTGTLSYVWQSSPDETTWSQIGTDSTYTLTSSEEGKKVRAIISYTDDQGFLESVNAAGVDIRTIDDGDAVFAISGTTQVGQALSITESTADPDGTGTLSYVWQSSPDETTWSQIGTDSTYTLTSPEEGKKVRAIISYTDDQGFSESVNAAGVDIKTDDGDAVFAISGTTQVGQALRITESTADPDGTGTLSYVWQSSDNSVAETIDVTSNRVTGSGTNQILINPSSNLSSNTEYYVHIAATAFDDAAGNSYAGISDTTSLSFTTGDFTNTSFGSVSNLYVIGRYLYTPFFTESFRNTDVFNDFIKDQTFTREISSGAIDLSAFTDVSETYTVTDLIFKLSPRNSSDIDIELKYSGSVVFNKANSSDSYYTSFLTTGLTPTIKITDTRNGGNSVLTNLFTFSQINISGTGYFETVNDVINIGLGTADVNLRYDSLDIDYTNTSNEAIEIDFNSQSVDNYIVTKTVNGTLVETSSVEETDPILMSTNPSDNATAVAVGSHIVLNFSEAVDVETGNIVIYKSSSDETTWSQIGTDSTYTLTSSEEGKKVRAIISYTDDQGFSESVNASGVHIKTDDGDAVFAISGTTQVGQALSITESTADPDGTGTLSYVWQSSPDETTWSQIGTDSTYTLTSSEEGKKVRAIISYTDDQGFSESVITSSIEMIDDGDATFVINASGNKVSGDNLSITESSADPDGTGTLSYVWQSSLDETTWSQIGTDSTYTLTSSEEGKKVRAIISYTDDQGFSESVTTSSIDINQKTYSLSTSINVPQEAYTLTTTASTENVAEGSTLYWSLSGNNISLSDFSDGALTGSETIRSDGTFLFKHLIANDGETEGYETIDIKLFSDSERLTQVGETKSILIRDSAIEEKIAEIVEDLNGVKQVVSQLVKGQNYTLNNIRDYDGNLHANMGSVSDATKSAYKYQHALDVNGDGTLEAIYTNMASGRWVTASINSLTGKVDYSNYGKDGTTRIVGIYEDPLIAEGNNNGGFLSDGVTPAPANFGVSDEDRYVKVDGKNIDRLALNSQVRFQNDLKIDNLVAKKSSDFDSDGISEVYWKTSDGTAYLRALMHADGNIRYANYQNENQMRDYLITNGLSDSISDII